METTGKNLLKSQPLWELEKFIAALNFEREKRGGEIVDNLRHPLLQTLDLLKVVVNGKAYVLSPELLAAVMEKVLSQLPPSVYSRLAKMMHQTT